MNLWPAELSAFIIDLLSITDDASKALVVVSVFVFYIVVALCVSAFAGFVMAKFIRFGGGE